MRILVHTCCGPCLAGTLHTLKDKDITAFFYNPNIHPWTEYKRRMEALSTFCEQRSIPLTVDDSYDLDTFFAEAVKDSGYGKRCLPCYRLRLARAAKEAKQKGFDAFTTTLLVSPYQLHDEIAKVGAEVSEETGVPFYYVDARPHFRQGKRDAKEAGLYMQKYCGCIYSEFERYRGE